MSDRPSREQRLGVDDRLADVWHEQRRLLLDVAYRMLGSVTDAEDVVQEAFARLMRVDLEEIDDVRGWLVVVVTRLCLDQLRSARARHEAYVGTWLPEPLVEVPGAEPDPADRVTLDDSVRMALLVVLERLSPAERAAFVLHDVFGFSFEAVGRIVGRSPAACRQLASRARRHIEAETSPARFEVDPAMLHRAAEQFIRAASSGDVDALLKVLDPDVVGWTDTGGVGGAPRAVAGSLRVAKTLLAFLRTWNVTLAPMAVNGEPGAIASLGGELIAVLALESREGLIMKIHAIANPEKLAYVRSRLGGRQESS
ncbi:MAG: RNA polymerase sigma factor SigJ [Actinomycetota bacterium]|nr:RNA polymerase sigma factor SigJ [Actinomycetota bacterium]